MSRRVIYRHRPKTFPTTAGHLRGHLQQTPAAVSDTPEMISRFLRWVPILFGTVLAAFLIQQSLSLHRDFPYFSTALASSSPWTRSHASSPIVFALIVYSNYTAHETAILMKVRSPPPSRRMASS